MHLIIYFINSAIVVMLNWYPDACKTRYVSRSVCNVKCIMDLGLWDVSVIHVKIE